MSLPARTSPAAAPTIEARSPRGEGPRIGRLAPIIIGMALLMQTLDATIVVAALPTMARAFGRDVLVLNLAITSYIIGSAVFLPLSGWAADRFGSRTVFLTAIAVFTLASILCGLSGSLTHLVLARTLQGFAGAMLMPVGRLVLLKGTPKDQLVRVMSYVTIPALIGPVIGPPLGGLIVSHLSWPWIFFINLPVGLLGFALVSRFVPEIRAETPRPLDAGGLALSAVALASLGYGFENVGRGILPDGVVYGLLLTGVGALVLYVRRARRVAHPILDFSLFRERNYAASVLGGFFPRLTLGVTPFLLTLLFQVGFGMSPVESGGLIFASAAGALLMRTTATRLFGLWGFKRVLVVNGLLVGGTFMAMGLLRPQTPHAVVLGLLFAHGYCRSLQFTGLNAFGYQNTAPDQVAAATTMSGVMQLMAQTMSIGGAAVLLHLLRAWAGHPELTAPLIYPVFPVIGAATMISLAWFVRLPRDAPRR